ncbi:MAG: ATP-dependent Clp protease proteolytic subunit [Chlamydiia bacterium]|nr:ATP-dependent Clp protease proteolytic subunit [Chlamydiia bacterium]MCH9618772.1 ATP-dependent Clp protease proteolytic subunit [Chlamydiia bacterium]MCH9624427.1 ATP-dependent Clp protease proteolytic subunit [Chlamydiia bacterium]
MSHYVPYVTEETARGERTTDIFSRLLADRIIFIGTEINDQVANNVIAQLIFLRASDPKKPISIYINSPGGMVSAGLAIYDTVQYLECDVNTYCIGLAASMGALLLCCGTKGKRFALPNSRIMIHQPSGGVGGTSKEIELQAKEILYLKKRLSEILAQHTGKSYDAIIDDSDRDFYMSAEEAVEYGLIDQVLNLKAPATV